MAIAVALGQITFSVDLAMLLNWEKLMCDPGMHTLKTYQWQKLLLRKWPCPGRLMWWIWKRHPSWQSQFCQLLETFTIEVGTIQKLANRPRLLSPLGSVFQSFFVVFLELRQRHCFYNVLQWWQIWIVWKLRWVWPCWLPVKWLQGTVFE